MTKLRYGDRGSEVRDLQRLLAQLGFFNATATGKFLERTRAAVMAFQSANVDQGGDALSVDGIVGKNTRWALQHPSGVPPPAEEKYVKFGDSGNAVTTIQTILMTQGFYPGPASGSFDTETRDAAVYFQQGHLGPNGEFLEVDGVVGPNTWFALRNPTGTKQKSGLVPTDVDKRFDIIPDGLPKQRLTLLKVALEEHNVREVPNGSNWGPDVAKYGGRKGQPWCCWFWSWVHRQTFPEYRLGGKLGRCMTAWRRANDHNMAFDKDGYIPIPGDGFVMLYRNGRDRFTGRGHIGYVLRTAVNGGEAVEINTVEGNSGNRVKVGRRRLRNRDIVGFINPFKDANHQPIEWETGVVKAPATGKLTTR